jgi:DNA-binding MarR family transcriptional regulator
MNFITLNLPSSEVPNMNHSSEAGISRSSIGMLIVAARRSIRQLIATKVVPLDITPHHYWMLMVLYNGKPMSLGELARAMWMDNPTVSRMVQQMGSGSKEHNSGAKAGRGFLFVGPDQNHGRRISIRLTDTGRQLCSGILTQIHDEYHDAALQGFSAEEAGQMRELMCKYIRNLDKMVAAEAGLPLRPHHNNLTETLTKASGE